MTLIYFVLGLGLLIFIHELGHFMLAKANGIYVERFSIGFGPQILSFKKGETEYCLSLLPFGGYVKMLGEGEEEESIEHHDDPRSFANKSILQRLSVVLAGPIMNLILPFILLPMVYLGGGYVEKILTEKPIIQAWVKDSPADSVGLQKGDLVTHVSGQGVENWEDVQTRLAKVLEQSVEIEILRAGEKKTFQLKLDSLNDKAHYPYFGLDVSQFLAAEVGEAFPDKPAALAGIQEGDLIIGLGEKPVQYWSDLSKILFENKDQEIEVKVLRNEEELTFKLKPEKRILGDQTFYQLGIKAPLKKVDVGFMQAIHLGAQANKDLFFMTFVVLKQLFVGVRSVNTLEGPLRIAQESMRAAERGIRSFIRLIAFLSMQLGILNLLPLPVLDGGHVVYLFYETIFRKPLPFNLRLRFQQLGMLLLLTLMLFVTFNDLRKLEVISYIKNLFS